MHPLLADRLYVAVSKDAVQSCAHSEILILQAYNVSPPPRYTGSEPPGIRDSVATGVLQLYHPCLLLSSIPLSVARDRNCLFRALSRGLYAVARTTTFICAYSRLWRLLHTGNGTILRPLRTRGYSRTIA